MNTKHAKILIVEDDEDDFILTSDHLNQLDGYEFDIEWVASADTAISKLVENQHDICLLDYQLGSLTGLSVLNQINQLGSTVPIIMLTGQSDDELDQSALDAGAADFLVKGDITNARFTRAIRYAIARNEIELARQQRIDAEIKNRSKDQFLAHLSHELRTPLTSILGYTELLLAEPKASELTEELNIIMNNGKHLLSLLSDILDLSKIAANKLELVTESITLATFMADLMTLMQVSAENKGLEIEFESATDVPQTIVADATRLRQVMINILYNAIKFTPKGQIKIVVDFEPVRFTKPMIIFDISDSGVGIPIEKQKAIFKPFEQLEDIVSRKQQGAGLGLAISNELIRRMNGWIELESEVGRGSTFSVLLPVEINPDMTFGRIELLISRDQQNLPLAPIPCKALVVDDIEDIRGYIGHILQRFGIEVAYAGNGVEALEWLNANKDKRSVADLVIMDIHMPEMDGRQAIKEIRRQQFDIPIIALTAATMKGVHQELIGLGFTGVVSKPLSQQALYNLIAELIEVEPDNQIHTENKTSNQSKDILIVEDDEDAAELLQLLLSAIQVKSDIVFNGLETLKQLSQKKSYHTVLLDKNLPDEDGIELARDIKRRYPNIKIVLVSGEEVSVNEMQDAGIAKALLKPVNLKMLKDLFS